MGLMGAFTVGVLHLGQELKEYVALDLVFIMIYYYHDQYRANGLTFMPVLNTGVIFSFLYYLINKFYINK